MNHARRLTGLLTLALALGASGCATTFDASRMGVPVTMARPANADSIPASQRFRVTQHATFGFWGLVPISKPSLEKALAGQLVGQKGVADLTIRVRSTFTDLLVTVLTAGLIVPRAVTFEGVVVDQPPADAPGIAPPKP